MLLLNNIATLMYRLSERSSKSTKTIKTIFISCKIRRIIDNFLSQMPINRYTNCLVNRFSKLIEKIQISISSYLHNHK